MGDGHYSGTVTAAVPATCGSSHEPTGSAEYYAAVYEVKSSGGSGGVPGRVNPHISVTTASATAMATASFTPPAGAVLRPCVSDPSAAGTGAGISMAITDTSGLAWTGPGGQAPG